MGAGSRRLHRDDLPNVAGRPPCRKRAEQRRGDSPGLVSALASADGVAVRQVASLTTSSAAVVAAFTPQHRIWTSSVDVVVPSLADATTLHLEVTHGLTYWNGRQTPTFTPARANVRIELSTGGQTTAVRAGEQQSDAALALAASASNRLDARIAVDDKSGRVAPAGWYAVSADVVETNGASTPVALLFSRGRVPVGSRAAATRAFKIRVSPAWSATSSLHYARRAPAVR